MNLEYFKLTNRPMKNKMSSGSIGGSSMSVSKPMSMSKPMTISKPISLSKPSTISKQSTISKPSTISKQSTISKPSNTISKPSNAISKPTKSKKQSINSTNKPKKKKLKPKPRRKNQKRRNKKINLFYRNNILPLFGKRIDYSSQSCPGRCINTKKETCKNGLLIGKCEDYKQHIQCCPDIEESFKNMDQLNHILNDQTLMVICFLLVINIFLLNM